MQIVLFFALFIATLAVVFALQNSTPAAVSFLTWRFNSSLALVLLISLAVGALISFLFSLPTNLKTRWTIRQQRKKMTELEVKLADSNLRLDQAQLRLEMLETKLTLVETRETLHRPAEIPAVLLPEAEVIEEDSLATD